MMEHKAVVTMNNHHHHHTHHEQKPVGNTSNCHDTHGMKMNFHGGYNEVVLFKWWSVTNLSAMVLACIVVICMAIAYEGLKVMREYLLQLEIAKGCSRTRSTDETEQSFHTSGATSGCQCNVSGVAQNNCACPVTVTRNVPSGSFRIFSLGHLIQTLLQMIQFALSYFLMLIAMTYNTYLFASVVLGSGIGYWLFGWRRTTLMDCNEHCH